LPKYITHKIQTNKTTSMPVGVVFIFNHIDFYFFSAIIEI